MFENNQAIFSSAEALGEQVEQTTQVASHIRKKNKKSTKELPRRIEIIPVSDEDKLCACGACEKVIRYEIKELMHHQPCVIEIVEQRREVVACENGCENQIITAPAPKKRLCD